MRKLLVLVLLLAACSAGGGGGAVELSVSFTEPLRPGPVTWTVTVTNDGDDALELDWPNGQRADVVLERGGEDVYRWSRAQMFTQDLGHETVLPGDSKSFELEDVLEVDAGDYTLTATVTTSNRDDLTITRTVTVAAG